MVYYAAIESVCLLGVKKGKSQAASITAFCVNKKGEI
jgi:hypothetical protein